MNFLKNLMIIAVLGAVGYGVYASLARNNADPGPSAGVAPAWPNAPQVELPTAGPPLALGANPVRPVPTADVGVGGTAPPLAAPPASITAASTAGPAPLMPYPSSATTPGASGLLPENTSSPAAPAVTLGAPISPIGVSSVPMDAATGQPQASLPDGMHNLAATPEIASPSANPAERLLQTKFAAFMEEVQKSLQQNKLSEALQALSTLYSSAELPPEQAKQVTDLLDRLAGTVVYSRQHYLEPAYMTQQGDTLDKVAQRYNVPWQLLAHINGLMPPGAGYADTATKDLPLPVGMELKVVRGPFEAVVHLDRHELTLLVEGRYAGRFAIGVGRDQPKLDGSFVVREKILNPPYYGSDGANAGAGDPRNPLGAAWIGLTDRIGIHGTNDPTAIGRDDNRGEICVSDHDLQDIYGILSVGSRVTIMR